MVLIKRLKCMYTLRTMANYTELGEFVFVVEHRHSLLSSLCVRTFSRKKILRNYR